MRRCSKGSRGLSVLVRVSGIFTTTSVSPRPPSRQCPSCYKIRAGRNLPDKELRYLRTLIVRAAVNRSFGSQLPPTAEAVGFTDPHDLPAPSTCQSLYFVFQTWQRPVFLINSHLGLFTATVSGFPGVRVHPTTVILLPKLRIEFAEFLNGGSLERLGLLALPTCVGLRYGHPICSLGDFLGSGHRSLNKAFALRTPFGLMASGFTWKPPMAFNEAANAFRDLAPSVPPSLHPSEDGNA